MKSIAITIDEDLLRGLDRLGQGRGRANRSELIRRAVRQFLELAARHAREEKERPIVRRNKARLNAEAAALIGDQAEP